MLEVHITQSMLKEAELRNKTFYNRFGNSGTHRTDNKKQRMTGYLAEVAIKHSFPVFTYSDDDIVDFIFRDIKIDSKAQGCNVKPLAKYSATLYEEQKRRPADYYIFSRVKNDFTLCWICGIISKTKFFKIAKLQDAGTLTNNFVYDQSRYEIQYSDLADINKFIMWYNREYVCH